MAQYLPTIDLWNNGIAQALRTGQLVLQSGQWITCGDDIKSRFDSATAHHIRAFHGATTKQATERYRAYKAIQKDIKRYETHTKR